MIAYVDDGLAFGTLLREYRGAAGLTQEALAERAQLSPRGLQKLEQGDCLPYAATLQRLIRALGLSGVQAARFRAVGARPARQRPAPAPSCEGETRPDQRTLARGRPRASDVVRVVSPPAATGLAPLAGRPRHNLPTFLTSFVGRDRELAAVADLLARYRLVTLTGPGGGGKTRLAVEAASLQATRFPDGVWLVELAQLAAPGLVAEAVLTALGLASHAGQPAEERLIEHLRAREALIVLDNCEHLLGACARLASHALCECPRLRILATSREPLHVGGEAELRVPPLRTPSEEDLSLDETAGVRAVICEAEGVRLFLDRAGQGRPGPELTLGELRVIARICRELDGIPLALELAAPWLAVLTLGELAERLSDRLRLLRSRDQTVPGRHQTIQAVVDWSYHQLAEVEQRLFRRLAVFAGGWRLDAAEAVCADLPLGAESVLSLLAGLVEKSLVQREEGREVASRYRMLETWRQYGHERLIEHGELDAAQARHAGYFLALAERAAGDTGRPPAPELQREVNNARAALAWAWRAGHEPELQRLLSALGHLWYRRCHREQGASWLERALATDIARAGDGPVALVAARARAASTAGFIAFRRGDHARADGYFQEALALYRRLDDRRCLQRTLRSAAWNIAWRGELQAADALFHEALAGYEAASDTAGIAWVQHECGWLASFREQYPEARSCIGRSLEAFRRLGDARGVAHSLAVLGHIHLGLGQWDQAQAAFAEVLPQLLDLGEFAMVNYVLDGYAGLAALEGHPERALVLAAGVSGLNARHRGHRFPRHLGRTDQWVDRARAALAADPARAEAAWAWGQELEREQAVAYALAWT
ncbi:MAG TPA: tetratricopeptide repeat protein [Chloroflexota bacterium]|jgi:non-specific serine/threonine protein kinase